MGFCFINYPLLSFPIVFLWFGVPPFVEPPRDACSLLSHKSYEYAEHLTPGLVGGHAWQTGIATCWDSHFDREKCGKMMEKWWLYDNPLDIYIYISRYHVYIYYMSINIYICDNPCQHLANWVLCTCLFNVPNACCGFSGLAVEFTHAAHLNTEVS